jgi:exopolyphosphatase/guanosine-5'-triphosphate,3'-diphosphate pyrophosphatase
LLDAEHYQNALYLSVLLRLAVLLHRSHKDAAPAIERIRLGKNRIELRFADDIKLKKPLLMADLEREQVLLKAVKVELMF